MAVVEDTVEGPAGTLASAPRELRSGTRQVGRVTLVALGTVAMLGAGVWLGVSATSGGGHSHGPSAVATTTSPAGTATGTATGAATAAAVDHSAHTGAGATGAGAPATTTARPAPAAPTAVAASPATGTASAFGATRVDATPAVAGFTLTIRELPRSPGVADVLRFAVTGPDGAPVSEFLTHHERPMHLIVAREDLAHFQHLHPQLLADGVWEQALTLPEPGRYRLFADFVAATGGAGTMATVTADVVSGERRTLPLPPASTTAVVDGGYEVQMSGAPAVGPDLPVRFTVRRGGAPVADLEPYLGSMGHLVVLRAADLAYVHAHPSGGTGGPGVVPFGVQYPSAGSYRLFLQFQHEGVVRTAEFTVTL